MAQPSRLAFRGSCLRAPSRYGGSLSPVPISGSPYSFACAGHRPERVRVSLPCVSACHVFQDRCGNWSVARPPHEGLSERRDGRKAAWGKTSRSVCVRGPGKRAYRMLWVPELDTLACPVSDLAAESGPTGPVSCLASRCPQGESLAVRPFSRGGQSGRTVQRSMPICGCTRPAI
jgi:hypothetical protein